MARPREANGGRAHNEAQHQSWVFGRIVTPGDLRVRPQRGGQQEQDDGDDGSEFFQLNLQNFLLQFRCVFGASRFYGGVPNSLFATPTASGVTTGVAAPTNSVRVVPLPPALPVQTLPEPSMATP